MGIRTFSAGYASHIRKNLLQAQSGGLALKLALTKRLMLQHSEAYLRPIDRATATLCDTLT